MYVSATAAAFPVDRNAVNAHQRCSLQWTRVQQFSAYTIILAGAFSLRFGDTKPRNGSSDAPLYKMPAGFGKHVLATAQR
jgi:hypothetical protein